MAGQPPSTAPAPPTSAAATTAPVPTAPPPPSESEHLSDPLLAPFLAPTFDPTAYLNAALPPLGIATPQQPVLAARVRPLPEVAAAAQARLAALAAHAARLDAALTRAADDLLRRGPRLAYAVELLRGEVRALEDALGAGEGRAGGAAPAAEGGLEEHVRRFVPAGLSFGADDQGGGGGGDNGSPDAKVTDERVAAVVEEPEAVHRLRELLHVRARLQEVVATLDQALAWPSPPSAASLGAGLVSVSGPTGGGGGAADAGGSGGKSLEERGQEAQAALRASVAEALRADSGAEGVRRAEARVAELAALVEVWKGTSEERARTRFVEGLAKTVAERRREEEKSGALQPRAPDEVPSRESTEGRKGLFGGLRRLRDEIYLE